MKLIIRILIFTTLVVILTGLSLEFSIGLIPYGLFFLIGLILISAGVSRWLQLLYGNEDAFKISKIVLWSSIISLILMFFVIRFHNSENRDNANLIIEKLDEYNSVYSTYPDDLQILKPDFIEKIPKAKIGIRLTDFTYNYKNIPDYKFRYFRTINTNGEFHYWIGYWGYIGVENYYNSKTKVWHVDD